MNLYFYGGSFDPPHLGHKKIVSYFSNRCDELLLIPAYHSPLKSYEPVSYLHRKEMLKIMFNNLSDKIKIIDYENDNKTKYTYKTIKFLKSKYPGYNLSMILGLDQFNIIDSWKNHEYILSNVNLLVISRPGYNLDDRKRNIKFFDDILIDISSKDIKNNINDLQKIRSMLEENVLNYMIKNKLYM